MANWSKINSSFFILHLTFCNLFISGGWLLVLNVVIDSSATPPQLSKMTSYRGISGYSSKKMVVKNSAMKELRAHLSFTQLRFHCRKQQVGRTFHVTTAANSAGKAVVQYFSGQTDVLPDSCGSFVRMENDNSRLPTVCDQWKAGKWSSDKHGDNGDGRLYHHVAFVIDKYHWVLGTYKARWECDDLKVRLSPGDFWKVWVR